MYRYLLREAKDLEVGVGSASCGDESLKVDESQPALCITSESGKREVRWGEAMQAAQVRHVPL